MLRTCLPQSCSKHFEHLLLLLLLYSIVAANIMQRCLHGLQISFCSVVTGVRRSNAFDAFVVSVTPHDKALK